MIVQVVLNKNQYHTEYTNDPRLDGRIGIMVWLDRDLLMDERYEVEDIVLVLSEREEP